MLSGTRCWMTWPWRGHLLTRLPPVFFAVLLCQLTTVCTATTKPDTGPEKLLDAGQFFDAIKKSPEDELGFGAPSPPLLPVTEPDKDLGPELFRDATTIPITQTNISSEIDQSADVTESAISESPAETVVTNTTTTKTTTVSSGEEGTPSVNATTTANATYERAKPSVLSYIKETLNHGGREKESPDIVMTHVMPIAAGLVGYVFIVGFLVVGLKQYRKYKSDDTTPSTWV